jgi:predicted O-methyltransferase YrrM
MLRLTNRLFGTHPLVAHCPGPLHDNWRRFADTVLSQPAQACRCPDLTIITWHSGARPAKPCGVLEKSLQRLGVEPLVLGRGLTPWQNIAKFRLTAEALERVTTPFVMGVDSCDAVVVGDPAVLTQGFRQHFACDLLFNATGSRCWPELPEFVAFESSLPLAGIARGRHWLNSGVFIGRTDFCRDFFRQMAAETPVARYEYSDQAVIKQAWPRWYPRVQIDYQCLLFQWFNEERPQLVVERPLAARQRQLIELLRPLGPKLHGAEIGVFDGYTSDALLRELPELDLWMVDHWQPYPGNSRLGDLNEAALRRARANALWWTEHAAQRRFILAEPSPAAAARFADDSLDFVFIDGNHLYEHVRNDLYAWWPKVRPGGLLTGHDYGVYGDAEGLWGVRRAVDEFAAELRLRPSVGLDGVWWLPR